MSYRKSKCFKTCYDVNNSYVGESIELKVARILNNKEPIKDGAPLIYTERKEGIVAAMNIRTDRWDIAVDAMDVVSKTDIAKRAGMAKVDVSNDATNLPDNGAVKVE